MKDDATLEYPGKIAAVIGLSPNQVNAFKKHGCRFFGRKTSVRWVREYLNKVTAPADQSSPEQVEHLQHSSGSTPYEQAG